MLAFILTVITELKVSYTTTTTTTTPQPFYDPFSGTTRTSQS